MPVLHLATADTDWSWPGMKYQHSSLGNKNRCSLSSQEKNRVVAGRIQVPKRRGARARISPTLPLPVLLSKDTPGKKIGEADTSLCRIRVWGNTRHLLERGVERRGMETGTEAQRCWKAEEQLEELPEHDGARSSASSRLAPAPPSPASQLPQTSASGLTLGLLCWELAEAAIRQPQSWAAQHTAPQHLPSLGHSGLLKDLILDYFHYDHSPFKEESKTILEPQMTALRVFSSAVFILV